MSEIQELPNTRTADAPVAQATIPAGLSRSQETPMQISSRTWRSAAHRTQQERNWANRIAQLARLRTQQTAEIEASKKWTTTRAAVIERFPNCQVLDVFGGVEWTALPTTFDERKQQQKAMTCEKMERLERSTKEALAAIEATETERKYGRKLKLKAFGGKKMQQPGSPVLMRSTIWAGSVSPANESMWPTVRELLYEGDERARNERGEYLVRFPPLPRQWTVAQQQSKQHRHRAEPNAKYWEDFKPLPPHPFDALQGHKIPSHLDIYPFGGACPVEDDVQPCPICREYRQSFGIDSAEVYYESVAQYVHDTSAESMERLLDKDLLRALDGDYGEIEGNQNSRAST